MARAEIFPGGILDSRRALYCAAMDALVVADLHWGYAISHRVSGNLLPEWGDEAIASRLSALLTDYAPQHFIWLGDSLHTSSASAPAEQFLKAVSDKTKVHLLTGNHDRRWKSLTADTLQLDDYFFHHGDRPVDVPPSCMEIIGHHHPAFSWSDGAGNRIKLPALVAGPRRVILPAFSPWAAGTPWNTRLAADEKLWAVAPNRVFTITDKR